MIGVVIDLTNVSGATVEVGSTMVGDGARQVARVRDSASRTRVNS